MKGFIELCTRRPVTVIMSLTALLLGGIFSFSVLPLQRLPEFSFPRVTVEALYPGLGAEDIRQALAIPLEDALSSVKGLERIRSVSRDGAALVVLDFRWGTVPGAASVLVREAIDAVYPGLPEGASKPAVIPGDGGEKAQIIAAVRSPLGTVFARNLAEYEIRSLLRRIDGVGAVILSGGGREELEIKVDLPRSLSRGLPPALLAEILASETANIPAGNAREGDRELVVVSRGKPASEEEIASLVLPSRNGPFVPGDLGILRRAGAKKESVFIASGIKTDGTKTEAAADTANVDAANKGAAITGVETAGVETAEYAALEIYRRPGADPVKLSREVRKVLAEASGVFGRDAEIRIIHDDGASIVPGLRNLFISLCLGSAAVMAVLFITLRSVRCSILAGLSLPFSMAASLAALAVLGKSLNNMSLSGMALGVGLVSDTSVIILDIFHEHFGAGKFSGGRPSSTALSGKAASVAASSFGGALTTAIVFIPVVFLPGPLGSLFGELSIALVVSIVTGWIYAQFALPPLYRMFYPQKNPGPPKKIYVSLERLNCLVTRYYEQILDRCIQKPFRMAGIILLVCAAGFLVLVTRPAEFVSADEAGELEAVLSFPPGATMETAAAEASVLGGKLAALPEFEYVFGAAGSEAEDTGKRSDPDYRKETFVFRCIIAGGIRPAAALAAADTLAGTLPYETLVRFPQDTTEKLLGLSSRGVLAVKGRDRDDAESRALRAEAFIRESGFASTVARRPSGLRPELRLLPNREAQAHTGLSTAETARAFYAATEGIKAGELELEGKTLDIKVSALELPEPEALPLLMNEGRPVFAGSVARFEYRESPEALARLDRSDVFYVEGVPLPGKGKELAAFLAKGAGQGFGRADETVFARYRSSLVLTVALVLLLLYLAMGAEFESLTLPLIFLLAIPFSLAGAGPVLFLAGAGIDSSSVLALMVLFGLSVNGGMVLYELAAEKCAAGIQPAEAVEKAASERFRPVLATALTTIFALLPLMFGSSGAKEHSMAAAMLGGAAASTILSLFALPPVLIRFLRQRNKNAREERG